MPTRKYTLEIDIDDTRVKEPFFDKALEGEIEQFLLSTFPAVKFRSLAPVELPPCEDECYLISIYVQSEIDQSNLFDLALGFGDYAENMTSMDCSVDEELTSVSCR